MAHHNRVAMVMLEQALHFVKRQADVKDLVGRAFASMYTPGHVGDRVLMPGPLFVFFVERVRRVGMRVGLSLWLDWGLRVDWWLWLWLWLVGQCKLEKVRVSCEV